MNGGTQIPPVKQPPKPTYCRHGFHVSQLCAWCWHELKWTNDA